MLLTVHQTTTVTNFDTGATSKKFWDRRKFTHSYLSWTSVCTDLLNSKMILLTKTLASGSCLVLALVPWTNKIKRNISLHCHCCQDKYKSWNSYCHHQRLNVSQLDCLTAHTTCLVCFSSSVNGRSKRKRKEAYYLLRLALVAGT